MRVVKKIIFAVVLISISIALLVVGNGYDMYKEALKQEPLAPKIENIQKKESLCQP